MFPVTIERIGAGFVKGSGKLITKRSGSWTVGSAVGANALQLRPSYTLVHHEDACVLMAEGENDGASSSVRRSLCQHARVSE